MEDKPLVSIIMGVYNAEKTVGESIDSIINQTYKNWKLIICDDCSTDKTYKIVYNYKRLYREKIILIKNDENLGLGASLNRCIKYVEGKYVGRQDGDDISLEDRLEKQVSFLEKNKEYDLVGTSMIAFDEKGDIGVRGILPKIPDRNKLALGPPFCHATIMMKAEIYKNIGGYSGTKYTKRCEDIDLWFRFFEKNYKGINLEEPLYKVRDGESAYKRRSFKSYIYATKVCYEGYRRINAPRKSYIFLLKPLIAALVPRSIKKIYYKKAKG